MPDAESAISDNLEALIADLGRLEASAQDIKELAVGKSAIASHPRYQYFGRAYGIEIASMEWDANEVVIEEQWQDLESKIKETEAKLFIWEAAPSEEARDRIKEMGLVDLIFSPLANRPQTGDFLSEMTTSIDEFKRVTSG